MAQALPRFCPRCGTPTRADMDHCATCGLAVEAILNRSGNIQASSGESGDVAQQTAFPDPAQMAPTPRKMPPGNQQYNAPMQPASEDFQPPRGTPAQAPRTPRFPPAPPDPQTPWDAPNNPPSNPGVQPWSAQAEPHFSPLPPDPQAPWGASNNPGVQPSWTAPAEPMQPPAHTPAPQPKSQRRGTIVLILLVVLLALGGGGYLSVFGLHIFGLGYTQSQIKTTSANIAVNYAGIDITIRNVQQAQNFVDDPQTANDGMLRLNLQEQNTSGTRISWDYNRSARLIVQGKQAIAPTYVKSKGSIAPGANQTSVIDFTVANGGNLSKIAFQLGASNEAQIQIPLAGQINLSQYQPKTSQQNGTMTYFGLNWTLTSATTSLNIPGQQAASGMEYLTLSLKVDSTLSQEAITGSPFDYLRVKAGGQTAMLLDTTLPVFFSAGETGKTGTATFLIPQNSSTCTLILLSQDPGASGQASTDFQLS